MPAESMQIKSYFADSVAISRQMRELNVSPKMLGVTVGGDIPKFYEALKGTAEYIYGASQWEAALPYLGNKEFLEAYQVCNAGPIRHAQGRAAARDSGGLPASLTAGVLSKRTEPTDLSGRSALESRKTRWRHRQALD